VPAALLLMDFQVGIVNRLGSPEVVATVRTALDAARRHAIPVIQVRVAFRDGTPEVSSRNKSFSALVGQDSMGLDDPGTQVVETSHPRPETSSWSSAA